MSGDATLNIAYASNKNKQPPHKRIPNLKFKLDFSRHTKPFTYDLSTAEKLKLNCWKYETSFPGKLAKVPSFFSLLRFLIETQNLVDDLDVGEQHPPAAVPLYA